MILRQAASVVPLLRDNVMSDTHTTPFDSFERGTITRRQLLQALGLAAMAIPAASFGQAPGGATGAAGAGGRGQGAPRDTVPLVPPFAPTGWKTVWLDHLSYQCADYEKAAAFYVALMGWKVRSDDGTRAVLEIGENSGDIIMRGGLAAPPPAALTDEGGAARAQARFDGFAWGIDPWNTDRVKAELEKRGLNPVADNDGSNYKAFRFKDPDGFNVWVTNGTKALRRKTAATGKLKVAAPFKPTNWKTVFVDHLSFEVADYRRSTAFYQALLGWQVRGARGTAPSWPDSPATSRVPSFAPAPRGAAATARRGRRRLKPMRRRQRSGTSASGSTIGTRSACARS
jgi:catechol 2,3-dioxygenase-like lactoylglutathione lyase family enzyme